MFSLYQSQIAAAATTQQGYTFQEDLFNLRYKFNDLQQKYADLEKNFNELSEYILVWISFIHFYVKFKEEKNRELSEKVLRQAEYDTIKDERNKLCEDVHRYEIENKR